MKKHPFASVLALTAAASMALPVQTMACCMVPLAYDVAIGQKSQEAIIFHSGDREELILKIHYQIEAKSKDAKMPSHFAWVITVPNEPDQYEIADPGLFEKVYGWATPLVEKPTKSRNLLGLKENAPMAGAITDGVILSEAVEVGPYKIQPVRAVGANALNALNDWLKANGFPTEDPGHMAYFVENNFTFLAVKVLPPSGKDAVAPSADLPPMHLSFKSDEVYYPLRFSSRQGVFDLNLTVLTKDKLNYRKSSGALGKINFVRGKFKENVAVSSADFPELLGKVFEKTRFKGETDKGWKLNVLRTGGVNRGNTIAAWKEDVFFSTAKGFFGRTGGADTDAVASAE